ncbi:MULTISPECIES: 50S ribosomal protein L24 [Solirubrobacterales]|uniref:50S ribosomal protein L24 n=1 Tax=Solirubrobacterales TaxID=588673 RepID=UPI0012B90B3E
MAVKIRQGDEVVVIAGKDRSKTGKVLRVDREKDRVYVEGLNIVKRHQRPMQSTDPVKAAGGVVEKEGPIHISNVMLLDPKSKKPTRVGVSRENGVRNRVTKSSGTKLD